MKKRNLLLAIALIATLVLGACGTPAETPVDPDAPVVDQPVVEEPSGDAGVLRIWADEQRAPVLSELGEKFQAEYGVEVVVENISGIRDQFLVAAPAGEGPDIIVLAHDQVPALTESGLIADIDLGDLANDFDPESLKAFTYEGKLYGMPYARENLGFFYNADLVETVPTTWDGVYDMGKELMDEGKVKYGLVFGGTSYDVYPMMTSQGGYVFGLDGNGDYDPSDLGVGGEGMIKFGEMVDKWHKDGVLSDNTDGTTAKSMFLNGEVPFFMNGPWEIKNLTDAGMNFGIAKFPDGGYPFMGVQGFLVSSMSENTLLAKTFLTEFVATEDAMMAIYEADPRGPAYLPIVDKIDNSYLTAIAEAGENAVPMPAIPAMAKVWSDWGNALTFILSGEKTPEEAYTFAAEAISTAIATDLTAMVNLPGSWQSAAGFACEWDPKCADTAMTLGDDGLYTASFTVPAGDYEVKVAHGGGWDESYGLDGGADNIPFTVPTEGEVVFTYDPATHLLDIQVP